MLYFFPVELAKCKTWISFSGVTARCCFATRCAQAQMCQSGRRVFPSFSTKTATGPSYVRVHNLQPPPPPLLALASTFPLCCQISESPGQVLAFQNNSNAECHCSGAHKWWKPSSFSHYFNFFFAPHTGVPNAEPCTLMMSLVEQSRAASWSVQRTTGNKRLPSINAGACRKDGWSEYL